MVTTLTLEQVKKAGRWAECCEKQGAMNVHAQIGADGWINFDATGEPGPGGFGVVLPQDGWHHLPGCDCPYCSESETA